MKEYENEQFKVEENQKFDEYQVFKAEDFKSLELFKAQMEDYKVKEIQKQSFVEGSEHFESNDKKQQKDNKVFDKLKNKIMSSSSASASSSATVATSIGASGAILCAGVIGAGVVLSPVLDIPLFNQTPIVEFINYQVDTVFENDGSISKEITIFFQEDLNEGYECRITNLKNKEIKVLDTSLDYVSFDNLLDEEYNFEVTIYNNENKLVNKETITANMVSSLPYLDDLKHEMLVTYNDDNTFNIYYELLLDYENYDFISNIYVQDESNNLINPTNVIDNIVCFEDISEGNYNLLSASYVVEKGNNYLVNLKDIEIDNLSTLNYQAIANEEEVTITINELVYDDVNITLTYLQDNSIETYTYTKEEALNEIVILLTKQTEEVKININANITFDNTLSNTNNFNHKGQIYKNKNSEEVLATNISTNIELKQIEILNDASNSIGYSGNATEFVFGGYLSKDYYYDINIYNSSKELIASKNNIKKANSRIGFNDLPTSEMLTIEYIVYDSLGNEVSNKNYETTLETPIEYYDADYLISYNYINSLDVSKTFNNDGTANYYFLTNFKNTSSYDAYLKISLSTGLDDEIHSYSSYSNDDFLIIENVPYNETYSLLYSKAIKDGIKLHIIDYPMVPSGVVNEVLNYEEIPIYYETTEELKVFKILLEREVKNDFVVHAIFNTGQEHEITIKSSDVVNGIFLLDLSAFEFNDVTCTFTCVANMSKMIEELEKLVGNLKGEKFIEKSFTLYIPFEYGSAMYRSHKIESKSVYVPESGENVIYKDIYINIYDLMTKPFDCKVINKSNGTYEILDKETQMVVFKDLLAGTYDFELQIIDDSGKIYSSEIITINTESSISYSANQVHDSLITYDEYSSKYNLYYYPVYDYTNNEITTTYTLLDQNGNELSTTTLTGDQVASFIEIDSTSVQLKTKSILMDGENEYVIADFTTDLYELEISPFVTNRISEDEITLQINKKVESDVNVTITYVDYGTSESLTYSKDTWTGFVTIPLSKLSSDVELTISANVEILNNNSLGNIVYYYGESSKNYTSSETLSYEIEQIANLQRIEILDNTYSMDASTTPTKLVFNGYKKPQQYLNVNVYNSSDVLIDSKKDITNLYETITFMDLITTEQVRFEFIIYDQDKITEIYKNSYQTSLVIPSEYTSSGISINNPSPTDNLLTFNNDNTYNAYFNMEFNNTSSYDAYYKITLIDINTGEDKYSLVSNESVGVIENIDPNTQYSVQYGKLIKDGLNYYCVSSNITVSGLLLDTTYENGKHDIASTQSEVSTDVYNIQFAKTIVGDLSVKLLIDGVTEEIITVAEYEITDNEFVLDLSSYTYTTIDVEVTGTVIMQPNDILKELVTIKGVEECEFISTFTINK